MLPGVSSVIEPARAKVMEQALDRLRALIVTGELSPGEQIRQQEMADQLGFSRVPLREALNVLADQGLLLHRPHQGYFVAKRAPSELAQIRRMLQLLEDELLDSMEWPSPADLKELKKLNQEMRKHAAAAEWTPLMRKNRDFHFKIFSLSPHRVMLDEVHRLWVLGDGEAPGVDLHGPAARALALLARAGALEGPGRFQRDQHAQREAADLLALRGRELPHRRIDGRSLRQGFDHFVGDAEAFLRQADEKPAEMSGILHALHHAKRGQPIHLLGHGPRSHEQCLEKVRWSFDIRGTAAPQRKQNAHVGSAVAASFDFGRPGFRVRCAIFNQRTSTPGNRHRPRRQTPLPKYLPWKI